MEKVKRKKKGERNVEDLRAEGVRGCTCEENFFSSKIELMSDVWQREKKKIFGVEYSCGQLLVLVGYCWWAWKKNLMVYFNGLLLPVG